MRNTYHDYQERDCLARWVNQASAECALPVTISGDLRELILYEAIKSRWNTGFNRYIWIVLRDMSVPMWDLHLPSTQVVGLFCTLVTRMVLKYMLEPNGLEFWDAATDLLSSAVVEVHQDEELTIEKMSEYITKFESGDTSGVDFVHNFFRKLEEKKNNDEKFAAQVNERNQKGQDRRKAKPLSNEFVLDGDSDFSDEGEDDDGEDEEEDDILDENDDFFDEDVVMG